MRTPDDIHDEWLVIRCQDGDREALAELVERWQPRLLGHAMRLIGTADGADDIAQVAWVAIVRGVRQLDDPACFRRWAYQILTHKCADWIRMQQRARERSSALVMDPIDPSTAVEIRDDDTTLLRDALRQLPPDRKGILSMHYLEFMSLKEIAHVLSLPVGTVKSRIHYARLELKEALERRKS